MSVRGEGQVIRLGERRYEVRIFLGRDATGKRKYVNRTVHGTTKDADKVKRQMLRDRDLGVLVRTSNEPLDEYLDTWLETAVKPRVQPGTHEEYARTLKRYVPPTSALCASRSSPPSPFKPSTRKCRTQA